ncbi:MAG: glycosyltransferase family 4 protein, partial [Bacteroidales bacterium]
MKVLQICNKSPYPPREGGAIAMNNITRGLIKAGHEVKVLAVSTPKYNINPDEIPEDYKKSTGFESVYIDTKIKFYKAFLNLFSTRSYNVERFISGEFDDKIKQIVSSGEFDIVQLESVFVAPYIATIRNNSNAKIILRAHNIEHIIWNRLAESCHNPVKKIYLKHLSRTLKNYENKIFDSVDGIAAITQHDADFFVKSGHNKAVISIPVGIDQCMITKIDAEREFPGLFHLGSMDWMPNQEGIRWFLDNVWGKVIKEYPGINLYLAGRSMPGWLRELKMPNVLVDGEVENAFNYMQSKSVMIVPLLSGSGMRVKIIEGMACGNTIISTSIGAEGIDYTNEKNILIANKPEEFVNQIRKCVEDPSFCQNIGHQAKNLIIEKYNNDKII